MVGVLRKVPRVEETHTAWISAWLGKRRAWLRLCRTTGSRDNCRKMQIDGQFTKNRHRSLYIVRLTQSHSEQPAVSVNDSFVRILACVLFSFYSVHIKGNGRERNRPPLMKDRKPRGISSKMPVADAKEAKAATERKAHRISCAKIEYAQNRAHQKQKRRQSY